MTARKLFRALLLAGLAAFFVPATADAAPRHRPDYGRDRGGHYARVHRPAYGHYYRPYRPGYYYRYRPYYNPYYSYYPGPYPAYYYGYPPPAYYYGDGPRFGFQLRLGF